MELLQAAIEKRRCIVSSQTYLTDNLILEPQLDKDDDDSVIRNWGIMPEIQFILETGSVALIGVDVEKSDLHSDGTIDPEGAYRTGHILFLNDGDYQGYFPGVDIPDYKFSFVSQETINHIKYG